MVTNVRSGSALNPKHQLALLQRALRNLPRLAFGSLHAQPLNT